MDQNKIGNLIKELRKKDNLTQEKFAEKYGVTYQAVSKWENGKNIPDISLLKQICDDYNININDFLEGKNSTKKNNKERVIFIIIISIIVVLGIVLFFIFYDGSITHKTLSSNCSDFKISGNIAYNNKHSYLYIPVIDYCGNEDNTLYKYIECKLYENNSNNIKKEIGNSIYDGNDSITLNEFLESVNFNIDNFSKECKNIKEDSLVLEINATDNDDKITTYIVPLSLESNCS